MALSQFTGTIILPVTHPSVRDLFQTLGRQEAFQQLVSALLRHEAGPFSLAGLTPTAKALYLVLLWQLTERPLLVVTDGNQRAEVLRTHRDIFRSADRPAGSGTPCPAARARRAARPEALAAHRNQRAARDRTLAHGSRQSLPSPSRRSARRCCALTMPITTAASLSSCASAKNCRSRLSKRICVSIGYEKREPVEMIGEYSIRGGILDVFPRRKRRARCASNSSATKSNPSAASTSRASARS